MGIAFFATQNTTYVPVNFFGYPSLEIPLYVVIVGSLFVGLALAAIISTVESLSSSFTIYGKEKTIERMRNKIEQLEIELANTRGEKRVAEERTHQSGVLHNLQHKLHF